MMGNGTIWKMCPLQPEHATPIKRCERDVYAPLNALYKTIQEQGVNVIVTSQNTVAA
jgi:hypothetical protein